MRLVFQAPRAVACLLAPLFLASPVHAVLQGDLRGIVHDPTHHSLPNARVTLRATTSDLMLKTTTNAEGAFEFSPVPLGRYRVRVEALGFAALEQDFSLESGSALILHLQLALAGPNEQVTVLGHTADLNTASAAPAATVSRQQIDTYAGADLTNSLRMITEFVPGAAVVHDQLHVRGGHQVTWAIDGVPLPNTNIATNVGPQFSPRDVDTLEATTGSYAADYGDRTYGVFNVATRTGFERDREAEIVTTFGNYNQTDDQLSLGDHSQRSAYYVSLAGNRSGYALEPPTFDNLHNGGAGGSIFTSLLFNKSAADQIRADAAFRADFFQVPNDPDQQAAGGRNREREQDGFGLLTWTRTLHPGLFTEISPFVHVNRAALVGGVLPGSPPNDLLDPIASTNRISTYEGGQATLSDIAGPSNFRAGLYTFAQQDTSFFSVFDPTGATQNFKETTTPSGRLIAPFAEEQLRLRSWLSVSGGLRITSFSGLVTEHAVDPRLGLALTVPRLGWILRASYARFYQGPPLDTVNGSLLTFASSQQLGFLPLRGERDEQHDFGVTVPLRNWTADFDNFRTGARNFFDHDALGNSNIFLPLTIDRARLSGWEARLRSPLVLDRYRAHLVYSNQQAEGFGAVSGGLTDFSPPPTGGFYLDHDQRNTLSAGVDAARLPFRTNGSLEFNYGSGFLLGDGPAHLPSYRTLDLSLAKQLRERLTVRIATTNVTNKQYQLDQSNTFGGSHVGDPRMIYGEVRWRVRY